MRAGDAESSKQLGESRYADRCIYPSALIEANLSPIEGGGHKNPLWRIFLISEKTWQEKYTSYIIGYWVLRGKARPASEQNFPAIHWPNGKIDQTIKNRRDVEKNYGRGVQHTKWKGKSQTSLKPVFPKISRMKKNPKNWHKKNIKR